MVTAIGIFLVFIVLFGVFLFFARRILRLALKLAIVGAIAFSLFSGTMVGWWRGWFESASTRAQRQGSQASQPRNSNRRSSPR